MNKLNNIEIIAHRGIWTKKEEQNSLLSLKNAISNNFGIETDVRFFNDEIIISHDPIQKSNLGSNSFEEFLNYYAEINSKSYLAINIKCDGIIHPIYEKVVKKYIKNFFFFDMTIPDMFSAHKLGCKNLFARHSSFENPYAISSISDGVWIDFFEGNLSIDKDLVNTFKNFNNLVFVSPELHGYKEKIVIKFWQTLKKEINNLVNKKIMICTDYPHRADSFFNL